MSVVQSQTQAKVWYYAYTLAVHPGICNDSCDDFRNMNINTIQEPMCKIFYMHVKCARMTSRNKNWHVVSAVQVSLSVLVARVSQWWSKRRIVVRWICT